MQYKRDDTWYDNQVRFHWCGGMMYLPIHDLLIQLFDSADQKRERER